MTNCAAATVCLAPTTAQREAAWLRVGLEHRPVRPYNRSPLASCGLRLTRIAKRSKFRGNFESYYVCLTADERRSLQNVGAGLGFEAVKEKFMIEKSPTQIIRTEHILDDFVVGVCLPICCNQKFSVVLEPALSIIIV